jgi:hypothetical protein
VLRWSSDEGLVCHTSEPAAEPGGAWLDEDGNVLIAFAAGVGLVCDRDLPALLDHFGTTPEPDEVDGAEAVEAFLAQPATQPLWLRLPTGSLPVEAILAAEVPARFGFEPRPQPVPTPD